MIEELRPENTWLFRSEMTSCPGVIVAVTYDSNERLFVEGRPAKKLAKCRWPKAKSMAASLEAYHGRLLVTIYPAGMWGDRVGVTFWELPSGISPQSLVGARVREIWK